MPSHSRSELDWALLWYVKSVCDGECQPCTVELRDFERKNEIEMQRERERERESVRICVFSNGEAVQPLPRTKC